MSRDVNRAWSADRVHNQFERDELANLQAVERRVVAQIGAMEEDLASISQTDVAIGLADGNSDDRASGTRTS